MHPDFFSPHIPRFGGSIAHSCHAGGSTGEGVVDIRICTISSSCPVFLVLAMTSNQMEVVDGCCEEDIG
ncbi:hypothetical protein S245_008800 [Arachis hypogaea]